MELVRDSVEDNLTVDAFVTAAAKVTETVVVTRLISVGTNHSQNPIWTSQTLQLRYFQVSIHFQGHLLSYFGTTDDQVMSLVLSTEH